MVQYYQIAGKKVGSHVLTMATLGTIFGATWLSSRGGEKKKEQGPPVVASSKDEEQFIQQFLKEVGGEENKAKH
ncbi:hypothetical protein MPDQ_004833 [Monascus purpureus]|uniref:ATP synthase subunit K, mitochondrial n=1 Tax=Monascus purpureus TaxID=5098 RepID=A0A507QIU9_MONPU|nr:hypothetical protein MPDQ_004833 [Monascus purpureus]BDD56028.1 hypothetical protein MAP00_001511 [Monascus purpureus]